MKSVLNPQCSLTHGQIWNDDPAFDTKHVRMKRLNKEIWGWALYDWANSAFAVSVLAAVYPLYFRNVLATSGPDGQGGLLKEVSIFGATIPAETLWPWTVSLSMVVVVLICPIIGAIADHAARKKRFLLWFCCTGACATMLMVSLSTGMWRLGMLLFVIANICFVAGNVVYNGLLTDVASDEKTVGFVSGFGWGLGYLASFLMLVFNMGLIAFEFPSREWAVRLSLLSVGVWWALFSIPTFLWVKEKGVAQPLPAGQSLLTVGFHQLISTALRLRRYPVMLLFMAAFFLYNDGVQTIITQAAPFANVALQASEKVILPAFVMIQIVAFAGSLVFIRVEKVVGTKPALMAALIGWILLIGWALFMKSVVEFYALAFLGGLILGVSQSASRTIYTLMIPEGQSAEFFSLYAIVGKVASLVGPLLFGIGAAYAARLENAPLVNTMAGAVAPLFLMVLSGTLLLAGVDVTKGKIQAKRERATAAST